MPPIPEGVWAVILGISGAVIGSFLNVVIHRLPIMILRSPERLNLAWPASNCPHCAHPIRAIDNIPLVSYLLLRGRCFHCGKPISPRYPLVELSAALLAVGSALHFGITWRLAFALPFAWALLCILVIDWEHMLIPDAISLPLLGLGLTANAFGLFAGFIDALIGAATGYLSLWLIFQAALRLTGKEAMGRGDFKLFAAVGAWLGWQGLPLTLFLACAVGSILGSALVLAGKYGRGRHIAFGPFLAVAALISLLWGAEIWRLYVNFITV
ncbi:MAG: hypothetical protein A3G18_08880 [Rhodospirillales bacterium RIFCSPLOWO2_12_FULL_58_28]|nr:MAG: hypothetical protein A3H92_01475 [Rhodospirillales bacterium RIFCSPLOWO2_02_FULL_58_16]OHC78420.1 MAG: hypothetical protein A3G18_08880 [Rhodospirillales bacterium RIFCSPLOWO2_12_FULL_58_28]